MNNSEVKKVSRRVVPLAPITLANVTYRKIKFYYCECGNQVEIQTDDEPTDFPAYCSRCGASLDYGD